MKKQSSRSQRGGSRGFKGKHVVQICVLLGVCIWLIYQVKYSHDKKKEFYEIDGKKSTVLLEREDGWVKLGRKDLLPGYHKQDEKEKHVEEEEDEEEISRGEEEKERKSKVANSTHEEEEKEDEDEVAEEDEEDKNKLGEEVVEEDEEDNKHEEDDIDEQDQSKSAVDAAKDDELFEEEKENGSSEKEAETNHVDEIDMTVDEAREEHYKADDASSAVSHESRILSSEKLKENSANSTGPSQENSSNATISEVEVQKEPVLKLGEAVEKTTTEVKDGDSDSSNSENAVTESTGETVNGNSTEAILEAAGVLQNETRTMQERSQEHDRTDDAAPPSGSSDLQTEVQLEQTRNETGPNITVSANVTNTYSIQDESRNSSSESSLTENISESNTTEVKESSRSEGDEETEEKESSNHFSTEQTEEADDTPESTMLQEEREALTDPQTLPDMSIEGKEEDDEEAMAAE